MHPAGVSNKRSTSLRPVQSEILNEILTRRPEFCPEFCQRGVLLLPVFDSSKLERGHAIFIGNDYCSLKLNPFLNWLTRGNVHTGH